MNRADTWVNKLYMYDSYNYHLYLPASIIYKDLTQLSFHESINKTYKPTGDDKWFCINQLYNGNRVNKYPVGVALHELPFFVAAHIICKTTAHPQDGYSLPYQWGGIVSNIFWVVVGLFILRKLLKQYFNERTTTITLLAIAFGTNLYYFSVFSIAMPHTYAFVHVAWVLYLTDKLYKTRKSKYIYLVSIPFACLALIRPSDLLVIIMPLLWGVHSLKSFKQRLQFLSSKFAPIITSFVVFMLLLLPQLLYWHATAGSWFYDAYINEGFIWSEPKIIEGLFGFRIGWYIYTPIAIIATWGLFIMKKSLKQNQLAFFLFISLNIYVIFSWWNWWYGGGFGARALIDALPVMSLPLAAAIEYVEDNWKPMFSYGLSTVILLLIGLNMFQSYQAINRVLHWDHTTKDYYLKVFLKTETKPEYEQYLLDDKIYYEDMLYRHGKVSSK